MAQASARRAPGRGGRAAISGCRMAGRIDPIGRGPGRHPAAPDGGRRGRRIPARRIGGRHRSAVDPGSAAGSRAAIGAAIGSSSAPAARDRPGRRSSARKRKPPAQGRGLEGRGSRPVDQASSWSTRSNTRRKGGLRLFGPAAGQHQDCELELEPDPARRRRAVVTGRGDVRSDRRDVGPHH
jgi:hypothetical protein